MSRRYTPGRYTPGRYIPGRYIPRRGTPAPGARLALLVLALALVAVGLGRPMVPLSSDVFRHLVVFDITQSMNVGDATPGNGALTRLEHAKAVVLEAATALPCGSELGLGLFTAHRTFLVIAPVEVCANYPDISAAVRSVDWRMAWVARSEIAKGVHSGLRVARALGPQTTLVFLTDGHEAPPLHPELRPNLGGEPGEVRGAIGGVGGTTPLPIPKFDPQGQDLGYWGTEDVMQLDELSLGRGTSVSDSYSSVDNPGVKTRIASGTEHLSALREVYLRSLADGLRLRYRRISSAGDLETLLRHPDFANERKSLTDIRLLLAGVAALLVAGSYVLPVARRRNGSSGRIVLSRGQPPTARNVLERLTRARH